MGNNIYIYCKIHGENVTHDTSQCRYTKDPYNLDADACEKHRQKKICIFHVRGMCKRENCPLKHITGEEATNRGLPPIVRPGAVMHPAIEIPEIPIPEEPKPDFETQATNRLPGQDGEEPYDHWYTTFDSIE